MDMQSIVCFIFVLLGCAVAYWGKRKQLKRYEMGGVWIICIAGLLLIASCVTMY